MSEYLGWHSKNLWSMMLVKGFDWERGRCFFSWWWFQTLFVFIPNLGKVPKLTSRCFNLGWFNHHLDFFPLVFLYRLYRNSLEVNHHFKYGETPFG